MDKGNPFIKLLSNAEENCSFKWWTKKLEDHNGLEDACRAARRRLSMQLASSFSESQFSHTTFITSGRRNRTGTEYLKILQVRFNLKLVMEDINKKLKE